MKFELIKQKCTVSSYKVSTDEHTEYEVEGHIFYVKGYPAFMILESGEIDPITPNGMVIYYDNKKECDEWLKNQMNLQRVGASRSPSS
jgi:hypothetical protein